MQIEHIRTYEKTAKNIEGWFHTLMEKAHAFHKEVNRKPFKNMQEDRLSSAYQAFKKKHEKEDAYFFMSFQENFKKYLERCEGRLIRIDSHSILTAMKKKEQNFSPYWLKEDLSSSDLKKTGMDRDVVLSLSIVNHDEYSPTFNSHFLYRKNRAHQGENSQQENVQKACRALIETLFSQVKYKTINHMYKVSYDEYQDLDEYFSYADLDAFRADARHFRISEYLMGMGIEMLEDVGEVLTLFTSAAFNELLYQDEELLAEQLPFLYEENFDYDTFFHAFVKKTR